jgi:hypothetical protein
MGKVPPDAVFDDDLVDRDFDREGVETGKVGIGKGGGGRS